MAESNTVYRVELDGVFGFFITERAGVILEVLKDEIAMRHTQEIDIGSRTIIKQKANLPQKGRQKYPDLFESFWSSYHKDRREDKKAAMNEWKNLTPPERVALPAAAEAYAAKCQLENTPIRYIIHPSRFIKTGRFESYVNRGVDKAGLAAVEFWDTQFRGSTGVPYPWKSDERDYLVTDVKNMGLDSWTDKVWFFFASDNTKIKEARENLGLHYNTFRSLIAGPLGYSGLKRKAACKYCGNVTGHSSDCPVSQRRRAENDRFKEEVEEGKSEGAKIIADWKRGMRGE